MSTLLDGVETIAAAHTPARWPWVIPAIAVITAVAVVAVVIVTVVNAGTDPMAGT